MSFAQKYKPSVRRHDLLLIAGFAWTIAGGILFGRGLAYLLLNGHWIIFRLVGGGIVGAIFYFLLFGKISRKHIKRIWGLNIPYPCAFSFFNIRSYFVMALMITGGILLRKLNVIDKDWLYNFFNTMGVPLLISASRFFYSWATNKEVK